MSLTDDIQRIAIDSYMQGARDSLNSLADGFEAIGMTQAAQMARDAIEIVAKNRPALARNCARCEFPPAQCMCT